MHLVRLPSRLATGLAVALLAPALVAQEAPKRPWTLQTDFGFVNTAGNTSTTTLNAGKKATYTSGQWTIGQQFAAVYGRTDGVKSAENYAARLRGDYAFSPRLGLYVLTGWDRNEFAGISRRFEEGTGLTFKAVALPRTTIDLEAGVAANQQRSTLGDDVSFGSGRGALIFKQLLGEKAYLTQLAEVLRTMGLPVIDGGAHVFSRARLDAAGELADPALRAHLVAAVAALVAAVAAAG